MNKKLRNQLLVRKCAKCEKYYPYEFEVCPIDSKTPLSVIDLVKELNLKDPTEEDKEIILSFVFSTHIALVAESWERYLKTINWSIKFFEIKKQHKETLSAIHKVLVEFNAFEKASGNQHFQALKRIYDITKTAKEKI